MIQHRKFKFTERLNQAGKNGILDVPHPAVLHLHDATQLLRQFEAQWGARPTAVVLPVTAPDGLLLTLVGTGLPMSSYATKKDHYSGFRDCVDTFMAAGVDVYLSIDPTLPFARNENLIVRDSTGDRSPHACIGNPVTQEMVSAILGTALDACAELSQGVGGAKRGSLIGAVLDVVNLFPMGAKDGRIEPTCFCSHCLAWLSESSGPVDALRTFPGPLNLGLKDNRTGIGFISDLSTEMTTEQVLMLCRQRGFMDVFEQHKYSRSKLDDVVKDLLLYLRARHLQVSAACDAIFSEALAGYEKTDPSRRGLLRILLTEGNPIGWTSGIELSRLTQKSEVGGIFSGVDEVWMNRSNAFPTSLQVPNRAYMWGRSRYYIDAFFSFVTAASDQSRRVTTSLGLLPSEVVRSELRNRLEISLSNNMSKSDLAALSDPDPKFVSCAFDERIGRTVVDTISIAEGRGKNPYDMIRALLNVGSVGGELDE